MIPRIPPYKPAHRLAALLLFKLSWWLLVIGQGRWDVAMIVVLPVLLFCLLPLAKGQPRLWFDVTLLAGAGIVIDTVLGRIGVLQFTNTELPRWLVLLWLGFGLTLPHLNPWLTRLSPWQASFVGGVAGTGSYWAGVALGAVSFGLPLWVSLGTLGCCWCCLLLLWRTLSAMPRLPITPALALFCIATLVATPSPAAEPWPLVGSAMYKVLFRPVYTATLHSPTTTFRFPQSAPFRLTLHYHRNIHAARLITATVDQWRRQGVQIPQEWQAMLIAALPDVSKDDELTLDVTAGHAGVLSKNGNVIHQFEDPEFTLAFAGIWLSERSTDADFRTRLIGELP